MFLPATLAKWEQFPPVATGEGGAKLPHLYILRLTSTKNMSMIKFDEWAKSSLSQQTFAIFLLPTCLGGSYSTA